MVSTELKMGSEEIKFNERFNLHSWAGTLIIAINSEGVNLSDVHLLGRGVVGGNGRNKSQGGEGKSHGGAHVDLHVGLMLVEVELVCVCFHGLHRGKEKLKGIITNRSLNSMMGD
jgi:hypothetical protein